MKHATVSTPITPQSVDARCSNLEWGPLPPYGQVTIGCLGCGKRVTVEAGYQREAEMHNHALSHESQFSDDFRATVKNDLPTNDLIVMMTWGMAAEKRQN